MPKMGKRIITDENRGILHLPDALKRSATGKVVGYARVTSWGQKSNGSLKNQADVLQRAIRAIVGPGKLTEIICAVEYGQMSKKRSHLSRAIEIARKANAPLCARDVSRFIRAEAYDRRTNHDAEPTAEDLEELFRC